MLLGLVSRAVHSTISPGKNNHYLSDAPTSAIVQAPRKYRIFPYWRMAPGFLGKVKTAGRAALKRALMLASVP